MRILELTFGEDAARWSVVGGEVLAMPISGWPDPILHDLGRSSRWHGIGDAWARGWVDEDRPGLYVLPYQRFQDLDSNVRQELGLLAPDDVAVQVLSRGSAANIDFRIDVEVRDSGGRRLTGVARWVGPLFIRSESDAVALPEPVSRLIEAAGEVPGPTATAAERLLYLARVKKLAEEAGASVDSYVASEHIDLAEQIGIDLVVDGPSQIDIRPVAKDSSNRDVPIPTRRNGNVATTVTRRLGDDRARVVLSSESRENANQINDHGTIRDSDVPRFLANPEAFIPEGVDLSLYGDRVKSVDIRVYNSRPYLHVRRNPGGWLEGALEVETEDARGGEETDLEGPAPRSAPPKISPETYRRMSERATDDGWVLDGDTWVQVEPKGGGFIDRIAAAGFDLSSNSYQRIDGVLQIFENVELLEYVVAEEEVRQQIAPAWQFADLPLPERFDGRLLDYQRYGYRWLSGLHESGLGALLADEMGLGKTVQVLVHLARLHQAGNLRPALIALPLTLMDNWEQEFGRFIRSNLKIHRHEGSKSLRFLGLSRDPDVVLVSYDTLRRDQMHLAKIDWTVVVCDEAQYVKNPTAQRTSVVKALKAKQRIALTGTPVENGLIEFWCIMDYVQPGRLGAWSDFRTKFERPIIDATEEDERKTIVGRLQSELQPHYLRRHKSEVLKDLSEKAPAERRSVELGRQQLEEYKAIVTAARAAGRGAVLGAIQRLLQLCARPPGELMAAPVAVQAEACPKLGETLDIVESVRVHEEKVVIFTRFLGLQAMLQQAILERFGVFPDCINGSVHGSRQRIVDLFSERPGFNVLILSHDVAGVGLNITAANHVIHYTRPWNPAKENQATDRVHRIGQERPVHVYLPIAVDDRFVTVEARLDQLLQAKEALARDVLIPRRNWGVTEEDLVDCVEKVTFSESG